MKQLTHEEFNNTTYVRSGDAISKCGNSYQLNSISPIRTPSAGGCPTQIPRSVRISCDRASDKWEERAGYRVTTRSGSTIFLLIFTIVPTLLATSRFDSVSVATSRFDNPTWQGFHGELGKLGLSPFIRATRQDHLVFSQFSQELQRPDVGLKQSDINTVDEHSSVALRRADWDGPTDVAKFLLTDSEYPLDHFRISPLINYLHWCSDQKNAMVKLFLTCGVPRMQRILFFMLYNSNALRM